jgi:hypothetical protein
MFGNLWCINIAIFTTTRGALSIFVGYLLTYVASHEVLDNLN